MNRFVFVALLLMAWAYWELSGGSDFKPETQVATAESGVTVTRADTSAIDAPAVIEPLAAESLVDEIEPVADAAAVADAQEEQDALEALLQEVESAPAFADNPLTTTADTQEAAPEETTTAPGIADLRVVTGNRVNLREGPGTTFGTVGQLVSGTILEVIETSSGWARIQVQGTTQSGWMSADFLTPLNG